MQIREILKATGGKLISGDAGTDIDPAAISFDSRTIEAGDFFLPLKGNNFDGEKFIADAFKKGATGTFVTKSQRHKSQDKIIIQVKDATIALQRIAHVHRMKFDIPVIAVTGSNGKTTVKDMIAKVLSSEFNVLKNEGTKNNHIGVPQTLLKLKTEHDICVLEMGANHKGEIRLLSSMAKPDVSVITNIGPSHLEFFKDLKGVFKAKIEILEFLRKNDLAIVNGDDDYLSGIKSSLFKAVRFGLGGKNDFRASRISVEEGRIKFTLNDKVLFTLNLLGTHNVYNALAAITVGYSFGLSCETIKKALSVFTPTHMRLNVKDLSGVTVIDDVYNSNPLSMGYALQAVKDYPAGKKWIVSADMLELGRREKDFHRATGESVAELGFDGLVTFGNLSQHTSSRAIECGMERNRVWHCQTRVKIVEILRKFVKEGDVILVKGSRLMKMEEVVEKLRRS